MLFTMTITGNNETSGQQINGDPPPSPPPPTQIRSTALPLSTTIDHPTTVWLS